MRHLIIVGMLLACSTVGAELSLVRGLENYLNVLKGVVDVADLSLIEREEVLEIRARLRDFGTGVTGVGDSDGNCTPAIESKIDGDFEGWEGDTIFKLANGQIWEQVSYAYAYSYMYRPDVTIFRSRASASCQLLVEGMDETIEVRRLH